MTKASLEILANALLLAVRAANAGGSVNLISRRVAAGANEPVSIAGSRIYVTASTFADGTPGFAPFTLVADSGREVYVDRPYFAASLGRFTRLTLKNANAAPGGIDVALYAGDADVRIDAGSPADAKYFVGDLAPFINEQTRPNDVIAYAQGDQVCALAFSFVNVARVLGGDGYLRKVRLLKSGGVTANAAFRLFLFAANPAVVGDNVAYPVPYSASFAGNAGSLAAVIDLPMMVAGGAAGASVCEITCEIPFSCDPALRDLWGILVADAAYVPTGLEKFALFLWADRY